MSRESFPPGPFHSPEPKSDAERVEAFVEARILELLEQYAEKTNEGTNGFIMRLRIEAVPSSIRKELRQRGFNFPEEDEAVKILKINSPGEGSREAKMQKLACDIVETHGNDPTKYAQVPKVYFMKELPITSSSKEKFAEQGVRLSGDSAEVIGMEFIEGDDLATALYREALRLKAKELGGGEDVLGLSYSIDRLQIQELQEAIIQQFDFRRPGGKGATEAERAHEQQKLQKENTAKLIGYLRRSHFVLDLRILSQIKNTLEIFHENGFAHRDAHHRNFMVKGSLTARPNSPPPRTFIVDFGTAETFKGSYASAQRELFHDVATPRGRMNFVDDLEILHQLEELTKSKEQESDERALKYFQGLRDDFARRTKDRNPAWLQFADRCERAIKGGYFNPVSLFDSAPGPDKVDSFLSVVLHYKEAGEDIRPDGVREVLTKLQKQRVPNLNRLNFFRNFLNT